MNPVELWTIQLILFYKWVVCADVDTHWTYTGSMGQSQWAEIFPHCGGAEQSPINVETPQALYDPSLSPVQPMGYNQPGNNPFTLSNNGHTVEMSLPRWMGVAGLPWNFTAVQLHLHWGSSGPGGGDRTGGSEHTINGRRLAAELHIVHYNSDLYANVSAAKMERNGLAVLGVLIEAGDKPNSAFGSIFNYLGRIRYKGQRVSIPTFDVGTLLPDDLTRFFRYNGSLTTPPCYQSVLWTVFSEKVKVSHTQLRKLETVLLSSTMDDRNSIPLQDNYRKPQALNRRVVLTSFMPDLFSFYSVGELCAMVIGTLCGCLGLAVTIHFVVKTIRSTSSWDVLPSVRPTPSPRTKDVDREQKQDVVFKATSDPEKEEAPSHSEP